MLFISRAGRPKAAPCLFWRAGQAEAAPCFLFRGPTQPAGGHAMLFFRGPAGRRPRLAFFGGPARRRPRLSFRRPAVCRVVLFSFRGDLKGHGAAQGLVASQIENNPRPNGKVQA